MSTQQLLSVDSKALDLQKLDALIIVLEAGDDKEQKKSLATALAGLPSEIKDAVFAYGERVGFELKAKANFTFDHGKVRVVVAAMHQAATMFELLGMARKCLEPVHTSCPRVIGLETRFLAARAADLADAFAAAHVAQTWEFKKKTAKSPENKKKPDKKPPAKLRVFTEAAAVEEARRRAEFAELAGEGTNLVRTLTKQAASELDCKSYVKFLKDLAAREKLGFEFVSQAKLEQMGAGAFLAVARGSAHKDAGIVKLTTRVQASGNKGSKKARRKQLALVGKGVMYDTGGVNVKPASYMFGMEGDMMGSAVALAVLLTAKRAAWDLDLTAYLAIADNAIGERAYRPNEVVTSLKGTTIETVHTDAEGRMLLADALHLAVQAKPDFILDFATLTGACVGAIGTNYAGVFSNRPQLQTLAEDAGKVSGERVWMFPLDDDYGDCLESEVADIKQCRLKGGVDHIEAAYFLKHFVGDEVPWMHVDLSPSSHTGGLAHVAGDVNGFGVRFATAFARSYFSSPQ